VSAQTDTITEVARVLAGFDSIPWANMKKPTRDVYREMARALAEAGLLREEAPADDCGSCAACDPGMFLEGERLPFPSRMNVCPDCGNKRCPKAANHRLWQCSGSNAVGQVGVRVLDAQNPAQSGLGSGSEGDGA